MGQAASKAAKNLVRRSRDVEGVDPNLPPTGFTDPSATLGGYRRGVGVPLHAKEVTQNEFYKRRAGLRKPSEENEELSPELLQFLKDAGPLQKVEVESPFSKKPKAKEVGAGDAQPERKQRMPKWMMADDEAESPQEGAQGGRRRDEMELMKDVPQHKVRRNTDFSDKKDRVDPRDFGFNVVSLFSFVDFANSSPGKEKSRDDLINDYYNEQFQLKIEEEGHPDVVLTPEEQEKHKEIMRKSLNYLAVPVLLKYQKKPEAEIELIGEYPDNVEYWMYNPKVEVVPKTEVKLVLEDLADLKQMRGAVKVDISRPSS